MRIRGLVAVAAMLPSQASAAPTSVHFAPSSPWVVDYAEDSCRLIRRFGEGKDTIIFAFESEAPGAVDMLISGKPLQAYTEEVPARFLPLQTKPMLGQVVESVPRRDPTVLWTSTVRLLPDDVVEALRKKADARKVPPQVRPPAVDLVEQAQLKAQRQVFAANTTAIEIDTRRKVAVILDTGSLGDAVKAFDQCSRDSLRDWGVDPDVEDKIVRPVWAPDPAAWFSSADYPTDMVMRGEESVVKIRMLVDVNGRVTKCTTISHFKEAAFNKITCDKFTSRAHFEPAELANGTKVPSYFVSRVFYRMPR